MALPGRRTTMDKPGVGIGNTGMRQYEPLPLADEIYRLYGGFIDRPGPRDTGTGEHSCTETTLRDDRMDEFVTAGITLRFRVQGAPIAPLCPGKQLSAATH
jgi:hypothetical protein